MEEQLHTRIHMILEQLAQEYREYWDCSASFVTVKLVETFSDGLPLCPIGYAELNSCSGRRLLLTSESGPIYIGTVDSQWTITDYDSIDYSAMRMTRRLLNIPKFREYVWTP